MQEASEVMPVPTPEPTLEPEEIKAPQGILPGEPNPAEPKPEVDATEPVASEEPKPAVEELVDPKPESTPEATEGSVKEAAEDAVSEEAQQGAERRHRRHRRRLQAAATTTTYDIAAETEAAASPEVPAPVAEPVKEQAPAADAPAAAGNTTTTIVAVPIDLGESEGGSGLKVVCITDSQSLAETYQIEFNMPGIKVRESCLGSIQATFQKTCGSSFRSHHDHHSLTGHRRPARRAGGPGCAGAHGRAPAARGRGGSGGAGGRERVDAAEEVYVYNGDVIPLFGLLAL